MLMNTIESRRSEGMKNPAGWAGWVGLWLVAAVGCGPVEPLATVEPLAPVEAPTAVAARALTFGNGLNLNGLNLNGLNLNGLNLNGLNLNGFSTQSFGDWFRADPAVRAEVMRYIVECAVPAGATRAYTFPDTGTAYQWTGVLGLAPGWSSGSAATTEELQVVSACMAAHANKFGLHVSISLRGLTGAGTTVATTSAEESAYSVREGCFFGNLFDGQTGVFAGNDGLALSSTQSSARVCAVAGSPNSSQCVPMTYLGSCSAYCTPDATGKHYTSCTFNGVTYRPVSTRMRPADIATCGNGKCEASETCSASSALKRCTADCGSCS